MCCCLGLCFILFVYLFLFFLFFLNFFRCYFTSFIVFLVSFTYFKPNCNLDLSPPPPPPPEKKKIFSPLLPLTWPAVLSITYIPGSAGEQGGSDQPRPRVHSTPESSAAEARTVARVRRLLNHLSISRYRSIKLLISLYLSVYLYII